MRPIPMLPVLLCIACSGEAETPSDPAPPITSMPLRDRTAATGPRFVRLDPQACGLAFTNVLKKPNVIPYVYSGAGVAVGDYDRDGLPDVYLVCQDGPNRLFRQTAPLRFQDVTDAAGGLGGGDAWGSAAAFADVDGDQDLDLYVCNTESPNLLYQNQGDGTFRECGGPFGLAITAASTGAAFADYDNDGDLDLFLLTNRVFGPKLPQELVDEVELPAAIVKTRAQLFPPYPRFPRRGGKPVVPAGYEDFLAVIDDQIFAAGQADRLLRNDGYALWHDVTAAAGITGHGQGLSACWWDCDGDGLLDLWVANDLQSADQLWKNRGDGTFEDIAARALPHTAFFGMGSDFGDLDNDGRFDFCVADMSSTTHYMGKMLMGSMGDQRWFLMNAWPQQYMRNAVYLNSGTERFLEVAHLTGLASTDWTWTVRFADLDDDGWLDLYATNGIPIFEDNPDLGAEFRRLWQAGRRKEALEIARNLPRIDEKNVARRNTGGLRFEDVGAAWGLDELGVSHGAVVTDLDRDGDLDVVVNNLNAPASVYENRGAGAHRVLVELRGVRSNKAGIGSRITVTAGGITQTRLVVTTRGYMSAGEAIEHFGLGAAATIDRLAVRWPSGAEQVFTALAADRHYTIREGATAAAAPPALPAPPEWFARRDLIAARHQELPFDDYAVQPLLPHRLSRLGPGIACGDVDADGREDVFVGGAAGQAGSLWLGRARGGFERADGPWAGDRACEDLGAVFVDHDGDGDLDLFVASGGIEAGERTELLRPRLYENDGRGRFAKAAEDRLPDLRISSSCVAAADFDRDGDVDLFVGGRTIAGRFPEAPPSVLLRNDGGRFAEATAELAPQLAQAGMVSGAAWSDLDGDGWLDLAVAAQWQPVRVHRNDAGKALRDATAGAGLGELLGQWNGIAAGDLDGDGDQDLVVTNLGLNTKYKASAAQPQRLFAADFDGNGKFDVVEANQQGEAMLPVRGRSCSSEAMPFLAQRFPTWDAFARASLPEIYGQQQLGASLQLEANELRNLVFENRNGKFVPHALPRLAQGSCGYGIGIADFDGDGVLDIALAQNSYSPEPETGRNAGGLGLVLAGRGAMEFAALPAHRSGVVMPEDGKALCVVDLDGDAAPDLLCSTNDGPVRTFVARGGEPRLAVRLVGPPGNPTAIGARLELVGPDGARQVRELAAGSGYLAQSAPAAFFGKVAAGSRLVVRWPDGSATEHELVERTGALRIAR
jgi:hypothetical protein